MKLRDSTEVTQRRQGKGKRIFRSDLTKDLSRLPAFRRRVVKVCYCGFSFAALLFVATGCTKLQTISTRAAGHDITVEIEGSHSIVADADHAVISNEFGKVTVEPARVQLQDGPWNRIPEQVPITVVASKHKRWVETRGISVKETFD